MEGVGGVLDGATSCEVPVIFVGNVRSDALLPHRHVRS